MKSLICNWKKFTLAQKIICIGSFLVGFILFSILYWAFDKVGFIAGTCAGISLVFFVFSATVLVNPYFFDDEGKSPEESGEK